AREEGSEVGLEIGEGRDRRTARLHRRSSIYRDRGGDRIERAHGRTLEALEELASVRAEALDEPPLAFGIQRIEGERGLAGPARTGERDELAWGEIEVDVLQVVGRRPAEADGQHGSLEMAW